MRELRIGDRVKVARILHGAPKQTLGKQGTVKSVNDEGYLRVDFDNGWNCVAWLPSRFKAVTNTPMTYRDALLHTLNGTMTVRHTSMPPGEYLAFNERFEIAGDQCCTDCIDERKGHWEEYIAKPKFTIDTLVYNTDGTIGKVVEDKGLFKGVRKYAVRFNAVREVTKQVKESELTEYSL